MGRWHRHPDGTAHAPDQHAHDQHAHDHEVPVGRDGTDMSGYATGGERIEVLTRILDENDRTAALNRTDFENAGVRVVNLMSSPGAGKTTLLRRTIDDLAAATRIGIIEGDIETSLDAERLAGLGASVALVNTGQGFGGECHLDAPMVRSALHRLPLSDLDLVVIENVGNLVCPAEFAVGEHQRAMIWSVTEGEDKPRKYPVMFRRADLVLINKIDLLPHLDVDLELFHANLRWINPGVPTLEVSARTGEGLDGWYRWLTAGLRTEGTVPPDCRTARAPFGA